MGVQQLEHNDMYQIYTNYPKIETELLRCYNSLADFFPILFKSYPILELIYPLSIRITKRIPKF